MQPMPWLVQVERGYSSVPWRVLKVLPSRSRQNAFASSDITQRKLIRGALASVVRAIACWQESWRGWSGRVIEIDIRRQTVTQ
jgi:hypothetical protein